MHVWSCVCVFYLYVDITLHHIVSWFCFCGLTLGSYKQSAKMTRRMEQAQPWAGRRNPRWSEVCSSKCKPGSQHLEKDNLSLVSKALLSKRCSYSSYSYSSSSRSSSCPPGRIPKKCHKSSWINPQRRPKQKLGTWSATAPGIPKWPPSMARCDRWRRSPLWGLVSVATSSPRPRDPPFGHTPCRKSEHLGLLSKYVMIHFPPSHAAMRCKTNWSSPEKSGKIRWIS